MTVKFYDVSHYQGDYQPTGPTIAKATESGSFVDSRYATTKARTLAGGWSFAGYHFLAPSSAVSIAKQAAHAFSVIGKTPAMLDVESGTEGNPSFADVKAFIVEYRRLGGILHLVYIPKWYWSGHWGSPSMQWLDDNDVALISSQYTTYSDTGPGWDSYGGVKPKIWQFTSTPLDRNAFLGTWAELDALFTGSTLTGEENDVQLTDTIHFVTGKGVDYSSPTTSVEGVLASTNFYVLQTRNLVNALTELVKAETADAIAKAVVAALPSGATPDQVKAAAEAGVADALAKVKVTVGA